MHYLLQTNIGMLLFFTPRDVGEKKIKEYHIEDNKTFLKIEGETTLIFDEIQFEPEEKIISSARLLTPRIQ